MRILIISTARSGSTKLLEWLCRETGFKKIHEPYNKNMGDGFIDGDNVIVKEIIAHINQNELKNFCSKFDKVIALKRTDSIESAISLLYCEENFETYDHISVYKISDKWIEDRKDRIDEIVRGVDYLNKLINDMKNCLHVTYENIYQNKEDILRIKEYLGIDSDFCCTEMLDEKYRLRNGKKKLI